LLSEENVFQPHLSDRIFNIGMSDIAEFLLLPELTEIMKKEAPNIELYISHINHITSQKQLTNNNIELTVGCIIDQIPHVHTETCVTFSGVIIARQNHPLMQSKMTLKKYINA